MSHRKYRSRAEWQALIDRQSQSGLGVTEFCKQHGLVPKYFYRKRSQLRDGKALIPADGAFVQVSPESSLEPAADVKLVLQYRDCQVQLPLATDPTWLSQLLRSL